MSARPLYPHSPDVEATASAWIARRDAGMSPAEAEAFARWAADPRHAEVLARHEQTWRIFDRPVNSGQAPALADEFRARFAQRHRRRITFALASLATVFVVGFAWRQSLRESSPAAPDGNIAVVVPEKRVLPDGTIVELRRGAEIAVDYSGAFRRVSLRKGEAHYDVKEDASRPFVVEAAGVEVRAVGTAFSVDLNTQTVAVLVTEGQVAVRDTARAASGQTGSLLRADAALKLVDAAHRLVVELAPKTTSPPVVKPVDASEVAELLAWRAPRFEFTGTPLAEAVALMNRHNVVQLVIVDPAIAGLEVSGYFRADNDETFLRLIEQGLGLKSERDGHKVLLRRAP
jgi:transmembrane sensor